MISGTFNDGARGYPAGSCTLRLCSGGLKDVAAWCAFGVHMGRLDEPWCSLYHLDLLFAVVDQAVMLATWQGKTPQ